MARIKYFVTGFNQERAKAYSLVAMVKDSVTETDIYNLDEQGQLNPLFKGAGIAEYKQSSNKFEFKYGGQVYTFYSSGEASSPSSEGFKLMMAKITENINPSGNSVIGTNTGSATRNSDGTITPGDITYGNRPILIDSQNARDQFATEILNGILQKLDADPASLDSSARSHYCQVAYDWAANMMTAAANARGTFTDETETSDFAKQEAVGSLDNTTDKLINNLIVALERTDEKKTEQGVDTFSKRVVLPDMQDMTAKIDTLCEDIASLKNNVTNALTNIYTTLVDQHNDFNQMVIHLGNISAHLQTYTDTINTNMRNIESAVNTTKNNVANVQTSVNSIGNDVTAIKSDAGIIKTDVISMQNDVTIIKQNTTPTNS